MKRYRRALALALLLALLFTAAGIPARAEDAGGELPEERPAVNFLSYEEAVTYFDFSRAASNWCAKFGMDPATQMEDAKAAILAGTDPNLIIGLATFARDTGHGGEKLVVNTAFRPACYQETLALHDAHMNTGPYRNAMKWNGRGVVDFWWKAEQAPGWPEDYAIDLSDYDIETMDTGIFYRAALRLWDNGWINGYLARPGCSSHNSGTAIDIPNYWIGANFDTSYEYNGRTYRMEDYGIYKPLQPAPGYAGETWHITSAPTTTALGNYDGAFDAGYEVVYGMYYNPALRGWNMDGGWGIYLGAGVACLQLRLCQLGLLGQQYITGYYCSRTEEAVRSFQQRRELEADGICGPGTMARLMKADPVPADGAAPALESVSVSSVNAAGFVLQLSGSDDQRLSAFRVETRQSEDEPWSVRYYNAPASGSGALDVDIWQEGDYEIRAAAMDAAGNLSEPVFAGTVFVDATPPELRRIEISEITETGFTLAASASDNGALALFRLLLLSDDGQSLEYGLASADRGELVIDDLTEGVWTITVQAVDRCGNKAEYTFHWQYTAGEARPGVTITRFGGA